jgi:hypothetical protein
VDADGVQSREVDAQLTLRIQPSFVVDGSELDLTFDHVDTQVVATNWDFRVISGGDFPPPVDQYLRSMAFRSRLQAAIQLAISLRLVELPSIDISFLGDGILGAIKNMTARSRVTGGALLLGLDVDTVDVTDHAISTTGDPAQLVDFWRDNEIAAVTNAVAVPIFLERVQNQVREQVEQGGATLESLRLTAQAGRFHVEAHASNSVGSADLSFNISPILTATIPGARFVARPHCATADRTISVKPRVFRALGFKTTDIHVDVDPATWLAITSVLAGAINLIIPFILFGMASDAAKRFGADIAAAKTGAPVPRVQRLRPLQPQGPIVRVEIADFEISTLGVYVGLGIRLEPLPGALIGITSIPRNYRLQGLTYRVRLPLGVRLDDPKLRIRWTVIDHAGTVLATDDGVAAGRDTFRLIPEAVGPGEPELGIGVRVYRAIGAQLTDFVNDNVTLKIRGPLPDRAYVRWYHNVNTLQVSLTRRRRRGRSKGSAISVAIPNCIGQTSLARTYRLTS